jgi:AbrB family looped-hinge helix DNA binding protein
MFNAILCWKMPLLNGILESMQVTIDKAGRIVVPKPIRDRLGLQPDTTLRVVESADGILLRPSSWQNELQRDRDGWLVFTGGPSTDIDWNHLVEDLREERMRKIGGW